MTVLPHVVVDVFAPSPFQGSPIAVVLDADALSTEDMSTIAKWSAFTEVAFVLAASDSTADYRVRFFSPTTEVRFAGLSTLAACRAWLDHGHEPRSPGQVIQECAAGTVQISVEEDSHLQFTAPPLYDRGGPDELTVEMAREVLGLEAGDIKATTWLDNGPGFLGLLIADADTVISMDPNINELGQLCVGVMGAYPDGGPADFEMRSFAPSLGVNEYPAAAALSASFATWLVPQEIAPASYTVSQGTVLGRSAKVHVHTRGAEIWVGGPVTSRVQGQVTVGVTV
ncbi:PhzF family phenazine biosynthesis protein [Kocuria sp.]|uniref:PhzF family phenazine biosynthesis protein n=1 Tax=Kocuria sp. TaxID=1871328 RepID=UPI0026E09A87|nr:PhzF family phenazine biosynthesis protein [Kocuria sp.]MDO5618170.1 PhzF family phenazine biosynthesis protein [Kocuria sp.]